MTCKILLSTCKILLSSSKLLLTLLNRYLGDDDTGMTILDVGLFTGFEPVTEDLEEVSLLSIYPELCSVVTTRSVDFPY